MPASNFAPGAPAYATSAAFSNTQGGWVAGGGLEWMITNNWLLRGEYLYSGLNSSPSVVAGSGNFPGFPSGYSWSNTNVSVARAALSYKF
jgi:outer membrane immunogenic protein